MSLKCGLFDSTEIVEEVGGYPRGNKAQDAAFFARYFKDIVGNGVLTSPTTNFQVLAQSGYTVQMRPGGIYINGYFAYDEEPLTLTIGESLRSAPVYVIFRLDTVAGEISRILSNTFTRVSSYDLAVAKITIPDGAVEITDAMITDLRPDKNYCGYVQKITDDAAAELWAALTPKVNRSELVDLVYPVGSIYMSANSANPGTIIGGTWEAWGQGRVPVGVDTNDTDFEQADKTGGSKTAQYPLGTSGYARFGGYMESPPRLRISSVKGLTRYATDTYVDVGDGAAIGPAPQGETFDRGVALGGTTEEGNNMPPYITCYMWKRVA